jgi:hypothetical protein
MIYTLNYDEILIAAMEGQRPGNAPPPRGLPAFAANACQAQDQEVQVSLEMSGIAS